MKATMDMSFGVGIIIGPSIGGVLYEVGGYMLPFFVLGGILLFQGFIMMFLLPESECVVENTKGDFRKIVFNSVFLVDMLNVLTTLLFLGFIEATLEPHIRPFGLQPSILGLIFIICGGFYAGSSLIWGCIFDKFPTSLLPLFISSAFCAASFIFVGPAPFIPLDTSLWLVIFSQIILGIGIGGKSIIGLNHSLRHTISQGLPDNMSTVAIVSGVFNSVNAFGGFLGPSMSGVLVEYMGFKGGSMVMLGIETAMIFVTSVHCLWLFAAKRVKNQTKQVDEERVPILSS